MSEKTESKLVEIFGNEQYAELNNIFEIEVLDESEEFLIREVRRKIIEKFSCVLSSLDNLINPNQSFIQMFDTHALDDQDREVLVAIIKNFGIVIKTHELLEIEQHDDAEKDFCIMALNCYKKQVPTVSNIFLKLKVAYSNIEQKNANINYLG